VIQDFLFLIIDGDCLLLYMNIDLKQRNKLNDQWITKLDATCVVKGHQQTIHCIHVCLIN